MKTNKMIAAVCSAALFLSGCAQNNGAYTPVKHASAEDDSNWSIMEDGKAVLENDSIYFELDTETTHFAVRNKKTGSVYRSVPSESAEVISDETLSRLTSEITVCYYAEQTSELYMYSDTDSVQNKSYTVKSDGNAIRVYYNMGAVDSLLPALFTEEAFENVLDRFTNSALRRRMERSYVLYSADDKPDDFEEKLSVYPILEKTPLYLLSDALTDTDKENIMTDISDIGYSKAEYQEMLEALNLGDIEGFSSAGFVIPLEYRLTEDGFSATVLSDLLKEESDQYKIYSIDVLEYFNAFQDSSNASYLIPDGSGAVIHLKGKYNLEFSKPFYGYDVAVNQQMPTGTTLTLPVYGTQDEGNSLFAIVEGAAETALLKAYSTGDATPLNHIYTSFVLRTVDTSNSFADADIHQFNLFAVKRTDASPRIRYFLTDKDNSDSAGMAQLYRNYLLDTNGISQQTQTVAPVYLDYLCMITEDASILGVPYTKKIVLSTVSEITESVEELLADGIRGISVRLLGYGSSGLENSAYSKFDIDRKVGTVEELQHLSDILTENGGQLYLDADLQFAYQSGNGFKPKRDSVRAISRKLARPTNNDPVTLEKSKYKNTRYVVSPSRFQAYSESFVGSLEKVFGGEKLPGVSYGLSGYYLSGDYSPNRCIDRVESKMLLTEALGGVREKTAVLSDYGNAYMLPFVSAVLNMPLESSQLITVDEDIPFFQMVISGMLPYAGQAENLSLNSNRNMLKSVEYGAAPYAAFITRDDALLNHTEWQTEFYSVSDTSRLSDFSKRVLSVSEIREKTRNQRITSHEKISKNLYCTAYENGYRVYVNYGDKDVRLDGIDIPAKGFAAVG